MSTRLAAARDEDALLAVGREAHVVRDRARASARRRSPPRRGSACRTRSSSGAARSACGRRTRASSASRAGRGAAARDPPADPRARSRGPSSSSTRTSAVGDVAGLRRPRVDRRPTHRAGGRQVQVREVGRLPRPRGRLGHVQAKRSVHAHRGPLGSGRGACAGSRRACRQDMARRDDSTTVARRRGARPTDCRNCPKRPPGSAAASLTRTARRNVQRRPRGLARRRALRAWPSAAGLSCGLLDPYRPTQRAASAARPPPATRPSGLAFGRRAQLRPP